MDSGIDPQRCPLCGVANACGMALGAGSCWCFSLSIAAEVLEKIPETARGRSCICRACATAATAAEIPAVRPRGE